MLLAPSFGGGGSFSTRAFSISWYLICMDPLHFNFISKTEMIALMKHAGEIDQKKRSLIWKKHKRNETFTEKILKQIIVVIIYMGRRKLGKIKVKMANRPF